LCNLFGVSKQAYYKRNDDVLLARIAAEDFVVQYVNKIREDDPCLGGRKLWHMYRQEFAGSNPVSRDRFEDIIERNDLKLRQKKRRPRTTDSSHGLPVFPNLVKDLIPTRPNELWVSDITYIEIWTSDYTYKFCYLSMILDAYTKEIVGWCCGETLETVYPLNALKMALKRIAGTTSPLPIHHSDRGCQYASREYVQLLRFHGIQISMTESGDPKENAMAERINNTMKNELLKDKRFRSIDEVRGAVGKAVDFYNNVRPHMSINMLTPKEAASMEGEIPMKWKSYRQQAIKKNAMACKSPQKGLPLPPAGGILPGSALQSTSGRNKTEGQPETGIEDNEVNAI